MSSISKSDSHPDPNAPGNSASSKKVKFVASDPARGGLPVKRKQVQHACDSCRRRKKRCIHAQSTAEEAEADGLDELTSSASISSPKTSRSSAPPVSTPLSMANILNGSAETSSASASLGVALPSMPPPGLSTRPASALDSVLKPRSSRFVGDLNPEGMFIEATGSASGRESSQKGDVGIWLSGTAGGNGQASQFITARPPQIMDQFLLPFVKENCLTCLPPEQDFLKLKALFINKIHPIFPVIPLSGLDGDKSEPNTIILKQLVSLAAASDPDAAPYLRLQNRGVDVVSPSEFSNATSSAVRAILETSIIADRVVHIRSLIMLSLYTQPTCAEEADLPAQLGGRAIHHIQTLGLHVLKYNAPNSDELETIFCAVWALDRINAAFYGRPCLLHERDIGVNLEDCIRKRPPCFRLLLSLIQWLDQIVDLYRPGPSEENSGLEKTAYIDLPVLEAMIVEADALKVPSSLIATIETLYHAIIILSCRLPRPGTITASMTLPPPSANARRSLAADRIALAIPRDRLSPVPFIPYAVSLALSVEYRKMRHSRVSIFRARAMTAFRRNCEMLRQFGDYFWSANVVASLGERVLKEMERAATTLTKETSPPRNEVTAEAATGDVATEEPNSRPQQAAAGDPNPMDTAAGLSNDVDFSIIDAISGQDVFGHIDPSFNLTAVEDALEANLDIGLPLNWGDWGQFANA